MNSSEIKVGQYIRRFQSGFIYKISQITKGAGFYRGQTIVIYESCESGESYARQIDNFEGFEAVQTADLTQKLRDVAQIISGMVFDDEHHDAAYSLAARMVAFSAAIDRGDVVFKDLKDVCAGAV
jgi:hypothetical protein